MVFVTGATGYIGRALVTRLSQRGVGTRCLLLPEDPGAPPAGPLIETVRGDITRANGVVDAGDGVETVVHSAGLMPPALPEPMRRVNVEGTRLMLEHARRWGVRRFVYLSAVSATYTSRNAYGISKLDAEELVRESGLPYTILRPTMVYGPGGGLHFQKLVTLVRRAPKVFPVIGPGTQRLQPVALADVISAIELACEHPAAESRTYGVSGATIVTFNELVDHIASALGRSLSKVHLPLSLCRGAAWALERAQPESFFTVDAVSGVTQDAVLDWSDFGRACGYSPAPLEARLAEALTTPGGPTANAARLPVAETGIGAPLGDASTAGP